MKTASEFRAIARDALRGRWGLAVLTGLVAVLLGGPVGIGTIISVFGMGTALQIVCKIMHFEPREVNHLNVTEATNLLLGKQASA